MAKNLCLNSGHSIFFFKNLAYSISRYHGQLLSCTISEKTNDPILRKLSDGQIDRWMDGGMDGLMDGRTDKWMDRRMDRQTNKHTDGRTDRRA